MNLLFKILGKLHVLRNFESNLLPFMDRFHEDQAAEEQWPEMCYWFSRNNSPVREEMSVFVQDKNNDRREDIEAQFEGPILVCLSQIDSL